MKFLFPDIETAKKIKLGGILEKLNQRHNRREQDSLDDCDENRCASTQFLQIQNNQFKELQEQMERFCYVSLLFGFNSAKCDLK